VGIEIGGIRAHAAVQHLITVATLHSAFSFKAAGRRAEADDRDEENEEGWSHESAQGDQRDSMCSDREPAADVTSS
jgi:hypothetical protein